MKLKSLKPTAISKLPAMRQTLARASAPSARSVLMLYLPRAWPEGGQLQWAWRDPQGDFQYGQVERLGELPKDARAARLYVWTPGADTFLTTTTLPTRARAKILQALPFALEDQLLGEPESMNYAYRPLADGRIAVAVTARARLQVWQEALAQSGLRPAIMAPITLALPWRAGQWTAAFIDGGVVVRTDEHNGFDCVVADNTPPTMLLAAVREARAQQQAPAQIEVFNPQPGFDAHIWSDELELPVTVADDNLWRRIDTAAVLSILPSGQAASGDGGMHPVVPKLRPAAIMLAVWVLGTFGFSTYEWWTLSREAKTQRTEMTAVFRRAFPEAKTIVDPALQMQRNLADLQARGGNAAPSDLMPLLAQSAPALQGNNALQLQGLQYGDQLLTLDIHAPDFQALEAVKNAIGGKGLHVEVLNSNSRGNTVDGKLRIGVGKKS